VEHEDVAVLLRSDAPKWEKGSGQEGESGLRKGGRELGCSLLSSVLFLLSNTIWSPADIYPAYSLGALPHLFKCRLDAD
jgi:hypothetical protein